MYPLIFMVLAQMKDYDKAREIYNKIKVMGCFNDMKQRIILRKRKYFLILS